MKFVTLLTPSNVYIVEFHFQRHNSGPNDPKKMKYNLHYGEVWVDIILHGTNTSCRAEKFYYPLVCLNVLTECQCSSRSSLIWVYTVCSDLLVWIFSINILSNKTGKKLLGYPKHTHFFFIWPYCSLLTLPLGVIGRLCSLIVVLSGDHF